MDVFDMYNALLFQSPMPDHDAYSEHGFDAVVDLDGAYDPSLPPGGKLYMAWFIEDAPYLPDQEYLTEVRNFVLAQVAATRRTLVHCAAGVNRASLVNGSVLRALGVPNVVQYIREHRPGALTNQIFVDYLDGLEQAGG